MPDKPPERYSPLWVSLHWAIAILLFIEFLLGLSTRYLPEENWQAYVRLHMPLGILILFLMLIRILVRVMTPHPEPATSGNEFLDKIGVLTHYLLYILAILMPLSGIALSISIGLSPIQSNFISGLSWVPIAHRLVAPALGVLILMHIAAALYHQFIMKDELMSRMSYGSSDK